MSLRIATVGHVDHGKSTLIGRLLAETGQLAPEREAKVQSLCATERRKFEYAFLLDALEEEQSQGITIDVTEVPWKYIGREYTFVDTPGHREFLKKMVGGASTVDAAVLMLDASEGVRETFRRQLRMLDLLQVREQIVLINKMDLVGWSREIWERRAAEVRELAPGARLIPASAYHGANLIRRAEKMPWYDGPTFAEALASLAPAKRTETSTRFHVQDVYRFDDKRIYVGRLKAGEITVGQKLEFHPGGLSTRVRSLEVFGEEKTRAEAGDSIGLTLEDPLFLERGALAFDPLNRPFIATAAAADLFWLGPEPIHVGVKMILKSGTFQTSAVVTQFDSTFDDGMFGRVHFKFENKTAFDPNGHFVACVGGEVLGGGRWVGEITDRPSGRVLWMTGLSGAGKTTLAQTLAARLGDEPVMVLDGDVLREGLCRDLGFSLQDREENIRRAAEVAKLFSAKGFTVICAFISPLKQHRQLAREIIGEHFREVFVDAPLSVCEARDVKGLYARARRGEIPDFTGIGAEFERPERPDLHLRTDLFTQEEAGQQLWGILNEN